MAAVVITGGAFTSAVLLAVALAVPGASSVKVTLTASWPAAA